MIRFRNDFYADVRTEDRSRTTITYKAGVLEEMKTRVERVLPLGKTGAGE